VTAVNDPLRRFRRCWLLVAAVMGFLAVGAGAFGAHGLRAGLSERWFEVYQTAVTYQMYHALALLGVVALTGWLGLSIWLRIAAWAFALGVLVFSGSLYGLVLSGFTSLGMLTPLGGVAFLAGWLCLAVAAWRGA